MYRHSVVNREEGSAMVSIGANFLTFQLFAQFNSLFAL